MSEIHIILHCLPREIDDLERILNDKSISDTKINNKRIPILLPDDFS